MSDKSREPEVHLHSPMPTGYVFVPKGDMYITLNVRKRTHASGQALYVVVNKKKQPIGLRCPVEIYDEVKQDSEATKASRQKVVEHRDAAIKDEFRSALLRIFPKVPEDHVEQILTLTLKKRSGRVGRTSKLDLEERVQLAVKAHIRHNCTDYDSLLRSNVPREEARRQVGPKVQEIARSWMGISLQPSQKAKVKKKKKKKRKADSDAVRPRKKVSLGPRPSAKQPAKMGRKPRSTRQDVVVISDDSDGESRSIIVIDDSGDSDWLP
ncbi:hypothetical protein DL546_004964 [Coniochaeta pulveracea]|uniref:DUF2293 domain-containing protein n=1 Tax=Coniochaeta pulveracea TaxID=177199 RepID=A0A420Y8G4_9PEZI|nr:hypothetical protein DL546_004964 [Coniochaeta pulveracea]